MPVAAFQRLPCCGKRQPCSPFDKARGRMVGSQDYLTKPFTKDQLLQTVQVFGTAQQGKAL